MSKKVSIVVPIYNSASFMHKLLEAVDTEKNNSGWNLELILIDDGSRDGSFLKIEALAKKYSYIKGIKLSKNFGHQIAVKTGLSICTGDYVAVIDDDLQDPPSLLPLFFNYLDEGYDVAYGIRKNRKENFLKKFFYSSFYKILKVMSNIYIPIDSGDFCVMKLHVVQNMLKLQEQNPFLRGIRAWVGFQQIGVEYERQARVEGQSGYSFKKLMKISLDGIFSFSTAPIRLITLLGMLGLTFAFFYSLLVLYDYFFRSIPSKGYASLVIISSFFSSIILVCLGIIGEYVVRIYDEVRARPYTIIAGTINI